MARETTSATRVPPSFAQVFQGLERLHNNDGFAGTVPQDMVRCFLALLRAGQELLSLVHPDVPLRQVLLDVLQAIPISSANRVTRESWVKVLKTGEWPVFVELNCEDTVELLDDVIRCLWRDEHRQEVSIAWHRVFPKQQCDLLHVLASEALVPELTVIERLWGEEFREATATSNADLLNRLKKRLCKLINDANKNCVTYFFGRRVIGRLPANKRIGRLASLQLIVQRDPSAFDRLDQPANYP